jgi:hypothetical protein
METPNPKSDAQPDEEVGLVTNVSLQINLRPALPVQELAQLQRMAQAEGVDVQTLIIRGIRQLLVA